MNILQYSGELEPLIKTFSYDDFLKDHTDSDGVYMYLFNYPLSFIQVDYNITDYIPAFLDYMEANNYNITMDLISIKRKRKNNLVILHEIGDCANIWDLKNSLDKLKKEDRVIFYGPNVQYMSHHFNTPVYVRTPYIFQGDKIDSPAFRGWRVADTADSDLRIYASNNTYFNIDFILRDDNGFGTMTRERVDTVLTPRHETGDNDAD